MLIFVREHSKLLSCLLRPRLSAGATSDWLSTPGKERAQTDGGAGAEPSWLPPGPRLIFSSVCSQLCDPGSISDEVICKMLDSIP